MQPRNLWLAKCTDKSVLGGVGFQGVGQFLPKLINLLLQLSNLVLQDQLLAAGAPALLNKSHHETAEQPNRPDGDKATNQPAFHNSG